MGCISSLPSDAESAASNACIYLHDERRGLLRHDPHLPIANGREFDDRKFQIYLVLIAFEELLIYSADWHHRRRSGNARVR